MTAREAIILGAFLGLLVLLQVMSFLSLRGAGAP